MHRSLQVGAADTVCSVGADASIDNVIKKVTVIYEK